MDNLQYLIFEANEKIIADADQDNSPRIKPYSIKEENDIESRLSGLTKNVIAGFDENNGFDRVSSFGYDYSNNNFADEYDGIRLSDVTRGAIINKDNGSPITESLKGFFRKRRPIQENSLSRLSRKIAVLTT